MYISVCMYVCVRKINEMFRSAGGSVEGIVIKCKRKGFLVHIMMELVEGPLAPTVLSNLRILA